MDKLETYKVAKAVLSEALADLLAYDFDEVSAQETDEGVRFCLTIKWDGFGKLGAGAHAGLRHLAETDLEDWQIALHWLEGYLAKRKDDDPSSSEQE